MSGAPQSGTTSNTPPLVNASPFSAAGQGHNPALQDSWLVDPLDTSTGIFSTNGMSNGPSSDAIFAWRDKQARKQDGKNKSQQRGQPVELFSPPPFVLSTVSCSPMNPGDNTRSTLREGQGVPAPSIQGILDTIRHRRRSSATSMRSELWKQHDQSALDTASLASEEIHPISLHPFDDGVPKLNQISPSPVNLPSVIETGHTTLSRDYATAPMSRMQLRNTRTRSSEDNSDLGKSDSPTGPTPGGLTATRPHLTALSPLQSFSPLHPQTDVPTGAGGSRSRTHSRTPSWQSATGSQSGSFRGSSGGSPIQPVSGGLQQLNTQNLRASVGAGPKSAPGTVDDGADKAGSTGGLSRSRSNASSVTRSLSRRQSFAASRASFPLTEQNPNIGGQGAGGIGSALHAHQGGLISKLLIVKAPSKPGEESSGNRARTKSSGSLTSFSPSAGPALTPLGAGPAQLPSSPSRPSAIPIRGASSYTGPASAGGYAGTPGARTSFLFDPGYYESATAPSNIHAQKMLSPEQVVEIAESLKSPIMKSDDDDAVFSSSVGGRLSRNSSYSRRNLKRSGSGGSLNKGSFNRGRFSGDLSFTPHDEEVSAPPASVAAPPEPMELEPMEYVEMNEDVFLPYIDRPAEVAELLDLPSNRELLEVIRPTFPVESAAANPADPEAWRQVRPEEWTWSEFREGHLMVTRAECDDFDWIRKARQALRARSECLWERFGLLLGVDPDMMNMGEEYDDVFAPGGALGDVFDSDTTSPSLGIASPAVFMSHDDRFGFIGDENARDQVWVEGLEANGSPSSFNASNEEDSAAASFGDRKTRMSDDGLAGLQLYGTGPEARSASPPPGAAGAMETIGEGEEEGHSLATRTKPRLTPAQRAAAEPTEDPFGKSNPSSTPLSLTSDSPLGSSLLGKSAPISRKPRTKSFVGLQIHTMPSLPTTLPNYDYQRDRDHSGFQQADANMPHLERGPGNPLFPASFASLSLAPTLPNNNPALKRASFLAASNAAAQSNASGSQANTPKMGNGRPPWTEFARRKSRGGLSESEWLAVIRYSPLQITDIASNRCADFDQ
ncbi:hypothetical protein QFC19_008162 [Naganishia cerealis]|uniref:Uncharacterized protein n=1 Tax=Naganishia cerealis TaxID=610337 RepID=A0ACC2V4A3_9TREE|nr:hypothetical protein QFC19_008162 [Naganishia cerealis]